MDTPIFEIRSLNHSYAGKTVLAIDHLEVQPASIIGLIGPNGSGKSSLLRLLGLIERPTKGEIRFNGFRIEPFADEARSQITLLPQVPFLLKRSVLKNVSYGVKLRGNGKGVVQKANEALARVGLPAKDFSQRPWYALSGGEAQRLALAARLALKPKVLLMDEPTASVDAASAQLIKEASLRARKELKTTLIVASHDWQWLYEICDEILHLFKGRIFGTSRETIIFGPWQDFAKGKWGKVLYDGQLLLVNAPPDREAAAVIEVLSVSENRSTAAGDEIILRGSVSRLSLERKTGQLFATILIGDIPFTVGLTFQQGKEHSIFPGKTVFIRYRPDQIKWI